MRLTRTLLMVTTLVASVAASGCGRTDLGRSPSQVVIDALEAASGADPQTFGGTLHSDVETFVDSQRTFFNDLGRAKFHIQLRDSGSQSPTTPTGLNGVTFTRYHVSYQRTDGRNTQGVDVPYAFDSAMTVTVPASGDASAGFEIVRNIAKREAPLKALAVSGVILSTIAEVTFYGKDLAGNDVVAVGSIGISFGDFADPD